MNYLVELTVSGADAAQFLQGYVTCDLDAIQPNLALPMALTDLKGRVIANGWCHGSTTRVALVFHKSLDETIKDHLSRYMVFAKSNFVDEIRVLNLVVVAVEGEVELTPFGWGLVPIHDSENELDRLTVEHELPIISLNLSGLFLPQMLNLVKHGAVSFTKGCYLGQEIVARAEHRGQVKRQLFQKKITEQSVSVGASINVADRGACTVVGKCGDQVLLVGRLPKLN